MRPDDLHGGARDSYDTWRRLGLSEQAAMDVLREDGLLPPESDHDRLVANFMMLGLSASEAEVAAVGRDGTRRRHVGAPPSTASIAERTAENRALVSTVQELAEAALARDNVQRRTGETRELAAVREAAWKVIIRLPATVAATMWAARVVEAAWPGVRLVNPH
jgi:hypothetical protein